MAERERSRTTIIVGAVTVGLILALAAVILVITTPWDDPVPRVVQQQQTGSNR